MMTCHRRRVRGGPPPHRAPGAPRARHRAPGVPRGPVAGGARRSVSAGSHGGGVRGGHPGDPWRRRPGRSPAAGRRSAARAWSRARSWGRSSRRSAARARSAAGGRAGGGAGRGAAAGPAGGGRGAPGARPGGRRHRGEGPAPVGPSGGVPRTGARDRSRHRAAGHGGAGPGVRRVCPVSSRVSGGLVRYPPPERTWAAWPPGPLSVFGQAARQRRRRVLVGTTGRNAVMGSHRRLPRPSSPCRPTPTRAVPSDRGGHLRPTTPEGAHA